MSVIDLPYDLHTARIDYAEAARLAGVRVEVVRVWKNRGHLAALPPQRGEAGPRFRPLDVLVAETKTRHRARRAQAAA